MDHGPSMRDVGGLFGVCARGGVGGESQPLPLRSAQFAAIAHGTWHEQPVSGCLNTKPSRSKANKANGHRTTQSMGTYLLIKA
jgi:hypothetical protein